MTCTVCQNQSHAPSHRNGKGQGHSEYSQRSADTSGVTIESLSRLDHYWQESGNDLNWDCLFVLPFWLRAWWNSFGHGVTSYVSAVRKDGKLIGIAPLIREGSSVRLMGDLDVSDYTDFIVVPGMETDFFDILIRHLMRDGINRLELGRVLSGSQTISRLLMTAKTLGCHITCKKEDILYSIALPATWEEFLHLLTGKQRHELRRKLRRLHHAGAITYRVLDKKSDIESEMDMFLSLFKMSRPDKKQFMTRTMADFFLNLADTMAEASLMKLSFLYISDSPAASTLTFHYRGITYLYNNGFDRRFSNLSVGLMSKIFSIRESIRNKMKVYDFLRGGEEYKRRLGSRPVALDACSIILP